MRRLACLLVLGALVAGCGGQSAAPVSTDRVEMPKSYRFDPAVIQVKAGTTVTWHNGDNFTHAVVFTKGVDARLTLAPGESGTVSFDKPGTYEYVCSFHAQQMKGQVIVVAQ